MTYLQFSGMQANLPTQFKGRSYLYKLQQGESSRIGFLVGKEMGWGYTSPVYQIKLLLVPQRQFGEGTGNEARQIKGDFTEGNSQSREETLLTPTAFAITSFPIPISRGGGAYTELIYIFLSQTLVFFSLASIQNQTLIL